MIPPSWLNLAYCTRPSMATPWQHHVTFILLYKGFLHGKPLLNLNYLIFCCSEFLPELFLYNNSGLFSNSDSDSLLSLYLLVCFLLCLSLLRLLHSISTNKNYYRNLLSRDPAEHKTLRERDFFCYFISITTQREPLQVAWTLHLFGAVSSDRTPQSTLYQLFFGLPTEFNHSGRE